MSTVISDVIKMRNGAPAQVADNADIAGNWRTVADTAERDAIASYLQTVGQSTVLSLSNSTLYVLTGVGTWTSIPFGAQLTSSAPANVGTANAVGVATDAAHADHVHAHGSLTGGSLHNLAGGASHGFQAQSNYTATADPVAANDSSQGYAVGSVWLNTTTGTLWTARSVGVGAAVWVLHSQYELTNLLTNVMSDPSGFVTRTTSTISVNTGTRTLSIAPAVSSFDFYVYGTKFTKSTTQSVVWTDVQGLHYFYFDTTGTLVHSTSSTDWNATILGAGALVAVIFWDQANARISRQLEERHGTQMDGRTHAYLHNFIGTQWKSGLALSGFTIGNGSSATHGQFAVDNGVIADEDIETSITDGAPQDLAPIAQLPVFYLSGAGALPLFKAANSTPFIASGEVGYTGAGGARPAYNLFSGGSWSLAEVGNGDYFHVHVLATPDATTPVIAWLGQATYASLAAAETAASTAAAAIAGSAALLSTEYKVLGTVIYLAGTAYAAPKGRVVQTASGANYVDFRAAKLTGSTSPVTNHGALSGLAADDHTQYVLATGTRFDDTTHGTRSGGTLHAVANNTSAGFAASIGGTANSVLASSNGTAQSWTTAPTVTSLAATSYLSAGSGTLATFGEVRLPNSGAIYARQTTAADMALIGNDSSNRVIIGSGTTRVSVTSTELSISYGGITALVMKDLSSAGAIWLATAAGSVTSTNYALYGTASSVNLNASSVVSLCLGGTALFYMNTVGFHFANGTSNNSVLHLANADSGNPVLQINGGLYVVDGALLYKGSNGTITELAPA